MRERCKGCNREMYPTEILSVKKDSGGECEDLCGVCRTFARSQYNYTEDHTHQFEDLKEGLTQIFVHSD